MLFAQVLIPLLPLTSALSLHGLGRRAHQTLALKRSDVLSSPAKKNTIVTPKGQKAKRLVRKTKKRACQVPVSGNNGTHTTQLGGNNWATPSSAAASSTASPSPSAAPQPSSAWHHVETWAGNTFFDNWNFWSWDDPTHGTVDYQDAGNAWNQGLIRINEKGHAIMDVDKTQHVSGRGRKSIRIHGKRVFTGGLVLMDAWHMPTGCGTWPAWWQNGPNWPYGGEIDILEGVNTFSQNQVSLHTGSGCKIPWNTNDVQSGTLTTGNYDSYNCASYETANQGCGVRDLRSGNSHGKPFNDIGGGVYALMWAKSGIKVWWFPRYAIPADITNDAPNPDAWGTPVGNFAADNCNPYQFFYDHFNIFDTTFCGDWAGADGVWNYAGYAGQDQSCAAITGYSTCADYVYNMGSAFNEAYWEISYVKYFNSTTLV